MPLVVPCATCGKKFRLADEYAGKKVMCPGCGQPLQVQAAPIQTAPPRSREDAIEAPEEEALPEVDEEPGTVALPEVDENEPAVWKNYCGNPVPRSMSFFEPPPEEIGPVLSAHSTLQRGKKPWPLWARLLLIAGYGLAGFLVGGVISLLFTNSLFWGLLWPTLGMLGCMLVGYLGGLFSHTCTYVGREGIARFQCVHHRDNIRSEVFCFRDAAELRNQQTQHFTNGVYQHTAYLYEWRDVGGRVRFKLQGSHHKRDGNPPAHDPYNFAVAAQVAWSNFLLADAYRQLELAGSVRFNLKKGRYVRLGRKAITFLLGGDEPEKLHADDVDQVLVNNGVIRIRAVDARDGLFSSDGVYKIPVADLANSQLFFHLLNELYGIEF